jgi:protein phosphatase
MGTTMVACLADESGIHLASVGDSRGYLLSSEGLIQLTTDHSLAGDQMRAGLITVAVAARSPKRNVLTRCLGSERETPEVDTIGPIELRPGCRLLLCSDGLYEAMDVTAIRSVLSRFAVTEAATRLVREALMNGSRDNISAVLIADADA